MTVSVVGAAVNSIPGDRSSATTRTMNFSASDGDLIVVAGFGLTAVTYDGVSLTSIGSGIYAFNWSTGDPTSLSVRLSSGRPQASLLRFSSDVGRPRVKMNPTSNTVNGSKTGTSPAVSAAAGDIVLAEVNIWAGTVNYSVGTTFTPPAGWSRRVVSRLVTNSLTRHAGNRVWGLATGPITAAFSGTFNFTASGLSSALASDVTAIVDAVVIEDETPWIDVTHVGTGRTATIASLMNDTEYEVRVRATNSVGSSDWSPVASATPVLPPAAPDAPAAPSLVAASRQLTASWSAPASNRAAITHYDVRYKLSSASSWTQIDGVTGTSRTITGLTNNSSYDVQVRAANSVGDSPWSPTASGTPASGPVFETVSNLRNFRYVGPTRYLLAWDLPTAPAGWARHSIEWRRRTGSDSYTTIRLGSTTIRGLTSVLGNGVWENSVRIRYQMGVDLRWSPWSASLDLPIPPGSSAEPTIFAITVDDDPITLDEDFVAIQEDPT